MTGELVARQNQTPETIRQEHFEIFVDPEAAKIFLDSGVKVSVNENEQEIHIVGPGRKERILLSGGGKLLNLRFDFDSTTREIVMTEIQKGQEKPRIIKFGEDFYNSSSSKKAPKTLNRSI